MNWTQVKIYTTTEGIEPLTGSLLDFGNRRICHRGRTGL